MTRIHFKVFAKRHFPRATGILRQRLQPLLLRAKGALCRMIPRTQIGGFLFRAAIGSRSVFDDVIPNDSGFTIELLSDGQKSRRDTPIHTPQSELKGFLESFREYETASQFVVKGSNILAVVNRPLRIGGCIHAIISQDGLLLRELSFDIFGSYLHRYLRRVFFGKPTILEGKVCVILEPNAETYGHWLLEMVPRILFAMDQIGDTWDEWTLLLGGTGTDFQLECLAILRISQERIVWAGKRESFLIKDALIPSYCSSGAQNLLCESIARLRSAFGIERQSTRNPYRKLYIERGNEPFRRITNEGEVIAFLMSHGFEAVNARQLSLQEKAVLFNSAEVVAGVVSSGGANCVFMAQGAKVVEIFPPDYISHTGWAMADLLGLEYACCSGLGQIDRYAHNRFSDIVIDLERLSSALQLNRCEVS